MKLQRFYKLARPDGFDFYTGKTINYRESIGMDVYAPRFSQNGNLCSSAFLHASRTPDQCFIGAKIPCSAYIVYGNPILEDGEKAGFEFLRIEREVAPEKLFKWDYLTVSNPLNPFSVSHKKIGNLELELLNSWASVRASVWASVRASVRASVWASVRASVWDSVWDSVRASVWASVWDSVRDSVRDSAGDSVRDSVWDSVGAYTGSIFFPVVKKWKYIDHKKGIYPFQSSVDLLKRGLVPSFDGKIWRLHGYSDARILWEGEL